MHRALHFTRPYGAVVECDFNAIVDLQDCLHHRKPIEALVAASRQTPKNHARENDFL